MCKDPQEHAQAPCPHPTGQCATGGIASFVLAPLPQAARTARDFVGSAFTRWSLEPSVVDTARTVASELVTNAYRHGSPDGGDIVIRVYLSDAGPVIEVWDTSPAPPVRRPFDFTAESGRGLLMLDAMVKSWGHRPLADGGKAVHALLNTHSE